MTEQEHTHALSHELHASADGADSGNDEGPRAQRPDIDAFVSGLAVLSRVGEDMNTIPELGKLLDFILEHSLKMIGSDSGSIFILDDTGKELVLAAARGPRGESLCGIRQKVGEGISGRVAAERRPLLVRDIKQESALPQRDSERYQGGSFLCVPLLYAHRLVGIINATEKVSDEPFTEEDLKLLTILTSHAASAIENRRYFEELTQLNRELNERVESATAELQKTNHALASAKAFNENIVKSLPLGLVTFDHDLVPVFCNDAAKELFGLDCEEVLHRSLAELRIETSDHEWAAELAAVVRDGRQSVFPEAVLADDAHSERVLRVTCSPLQDAERKIVGGLLLVEDITEATALEKKLALAERMAVVGRLAARVAHELNNPLDGILRFTNLAMRKREADDPTQRYLEEAKKGPLRMAKIISSLLEFSRCTHAPNEEADVNALIKDAAAALEGIITRSGVVMEYDLVPELPSIQPGDIYQVFVNLIKNAVDAMPDGGSLRIATAMRDGKLTIEFTDTGVGMSEETMKRIFEPFFTTKQAGHGTGLGLAISRDVVEKYGGKLSVQSQPGSGTTFTIEMPVPPSAQNATANSEETTS